jgi:organic radical activating enzyme
MKKKTTARLIIDFDCHRDCSYCCNKYKPVMKNAIPINLTDEINNFDYICVTGGEPMLKPDRTKEVLPLLDGMDFTMHDGTIVDLEGLDNIQNDIVDSRLYRSSHKKRQKTFRLCAFPHVNLKEKLIEQLWDQIKTAPPLTEEEMTLKPGETLFYLRQGSYE